MNDLNATINLLKNIQHHNDDNGHELAIYILGLVNKEKSLIRLHRFIRGISQEQLAKIIRINQSRVSRAERGLFSNGKKDKEARGRICKYFGISEKLLFFAIGESK